MQDAFSENGPWRSRIADIGLGIEGTRLEPLIARVHDEIIHAGIVRFRPRFYLSTEWGVPFGTVAIAIPFYLASERLTAIHGEQVGHVEGTDPDDIIRYLRHE